MLIDARVDANVLVMETVVGLVRTAPVFVSEVLDARHEQTAPAEAFAESAVASPQALVAHPRALITIEFDIYMERTENS